MRIGVVFPQTEIGADVEGIRAYVQAVEEMSFTHLTIFDHVVGAGTTSRPDFRGPYTDQHMFHEPMVLFGFAAAVTRTLELVTSVLILPQRQTVLVAKQAAEVDLLARGRFRLGVGIGWNDVEFEALDESFRTRGKRVEEQIEVLRALWTTPLVTLHGRYHRIVDAGINPLPVQRPIPVWMGGSHEAVLERVGRLADGWFPLTRVFGPNEKTLEAIERIRGHARRAGRDPDAIGIEPLVVATSPNPDEWMGPVEWWRRHGATHLMVNTMNGGLMGPDAHINALRRFRDACGATN